MATPAISRAPHHTPNGATRVRYAVEQRNDNGWIAHSIHDERGDAIVALGALIRSRGSSDLRASDLHPAAF